MTFGTMLISEREGRRIMATVEDYMSGKVLVMVKRTLDLLGSSEGSLKDSPLGVKMVEETRRQLDPRRMSTESASRLTQEARVCAVGERACRSLHPDSPCTEAVFLDELADGMVQAGKATYITKEEAVAVLEKYPRNPVVVTKVSGKHAEICNTWQERCVYWSMQRRGLKCLGKME